MKDNAQQNRLDPDAPTSALEFEFEDHDESEVSDDAFVIGEDGNEIRDPNLGVTHESDPRTTRWARPAAYVLVALFVVLSFWNAVHFVEGPPPPPIPSPFQSKQALYLGVMKLDAYRRVHGVVPETLADAGLPEAGTYAYRRVSSTRYVLSFSGGGSKLEYDSSDPKERFFGSPKDMLTMGDSK